MTDGAAFKDSFTKRSCDTFFVHTVACGLVLFIINDMPFGNDLFIVKKSK